MPNIIITGASDGIGAELARQLARRHGLQAMLVLAARNAAGLQAVAADCMAMGARTLIMPTDITDAQQCRHLVETTVSQLGSLDILINNAGVSAHALFEDVKADDLGWYEELMRVNLWGAVCCTHAALPALKESHGRIVAVSSLAGVTLPHVFAAEDNTLQIALIGAGGRGTGAADQALGQTSLPTKLVAMADVFEHKLNESYSGLSNQWKTTPGKVDVPEDRRFLGFDAYKQALDVLKAGDIAILTTPLAFRAPMFEYAINKGLHVFMEKPVTADGPSSRRMLELAKKADEKNLKCGVGLMVRHCRGRQELHKRIQDGEIGEINFMRSYRMHGPVASAFSVRKPADKNEVLYQIERFHSFLWASGGLFSDFYIHFIDECCWMKNAWPVRAHALGGRHYRGDYIDQNFDSYAVEYTFADGTVVGLGSVSQHSSRYFS
jgi:predicted dehydrogenase